MLALCRSRCTSSKRWVLQSGAMQGATQAEWKQAHGSALLLGQRGADLEEQMGSSACVLVMDYIPGRALLSEQEPFQAPHLLRTAEDLGRCRVPTLLFRWTGAPAMQELIRCLRAIPIDRGQSLLPESPRGCLMCTSYRCCWQVAHSNPPLHVIDSASEALREGSSWES